MTEPTTTATAGTINHGALHGYGRITWPMLAAALTGIPAAWADYHGFHVGTAPAEAPPYTHLWAWADGWLLRARIDGQHAIVAVLSLTGDLPSGPNPLGVPEPVTVVRRTSHTWPADEPRVGPLEGPVAARTAELYQVDGEHPITFVRLR